MFSQDLYQKAIDFAAKAHNGQTLLGKGYSYVVHLSNVAMEVISAVADAYKNSEDVNSDLAVQCALLHDTIEDTGVTYEEIASVFGISVAEGVQALTKDKGLDKSEQMQDSLNRIKKQPKQIQMVKMADRITNLQEPPQHWSIEKRAKYLEEAKLIHNELMDSNKFLALRLSEKIKEYQIFIREKQS